jgi:hypothetical protein
VHYQKETDMPLPTFIVIGTVKAGTTSLHHYLSQHPDIQMSQWVWPRFFHIDGAPPNFKLLAESFGPDRYLESEYRFNLMFPARIPRDIDTSFKVNMSIRHNKSMLHKDNFLTRQIKSNRQLKKQLLTLIPPKIVFFLRKQIVERSLIDPPPLKPEEYNQLIETFRDEILCLQDLLKRDLSSWLKNHFSCKIIVNYFFRHIFWQVIHMR